LGEEEMERIIWSYSVFLQGMVVSVNSKDKTSFETVEKPATSEADGKCPSRRLCCGTKSRGITAKERYLRDAYIEVRCSDEG